MINSQGFLLSDINPEQVVSRDLINLQSFPSYRIVKAIWGSLLGKDNQELLKQSLYMNSQFISYVVKTREDFINDHANFQKYPKMNESDWE